MMPIELNKNKKTSTQSDVLFSICNSELMKNFIKKSNTQSDVFLITTVLVTEIKNQKKR